MNKKQLITLAEHNIWTAIEDYKAHTYRTEILDDISSSFVNRLAEDSVEAKADLRNLFCKAPTWDNDLQAIIINGNRTHDPNYGRIYTLAHDILFNVIENSDYSTRTLIYDAIHFFSDTTFDKQEKYIAAINSLAPKAYKPNKKKSRIFKALCDSLGVSDESAGSDFQKNYAKFADELSSKKINFKLYVSINPAHFLTMSNPKNDSRGDTLTSCHSLNKTDYTFNCGCSGYARDNVTFIVFTVADSDNPETLNNRKTTRQIFAYKPYNGLLLQSRLYNTSGGTYGSQEDSKVYRDLIQRELSALEHAPNFWKTYTYFSNKHCEIKAGEGFGGYPDWIYERFDAKISIRSDHNHDFKPFSVGTYGLCISCAEEIDEGLYCDNCKTWETCDCCNERCNETWLVHNHDGYEIYVCESCLEDYICCEHCDEYFLYDDMTRIDDYHYVCQHCLDDLYELCDCCDDHYLTEEMYDAVDQYGYDTRICENCRDDYYLCDECNRYVHADDAIEATNSDGDKVYLCPECRNRDYQECDNCKGIFHEDLIEDDICPDCHAQQEEENHSEVIA